MTIREQHIPDDCLSDFVLDALRIGALDPSRGPEVRRHLLSCRRCRARQQQLDADAEASELPPLPASPLPFRRRLRTITLYTAAVAALIVFVVIGVETQPELIEKSPDTGDYVSTRVKGTARLLFHVRRDERVFEGGPGEVLYPGDTVRFAYSWSQGGTIAVLSRDGAGVLSVYFPATDAMHEITAGHAISLPGAVLLDDTTGAEIFYGVFCTRRVPVERLRQAVAQHPQDPRPPSGCTIDQIRVRKEARD